MEFQLFDRVRVKDGKELIRFTNEKPGYVTNFNFKNKEYEVEFSAGGMTTRILVPENSLEKVLE